MIKFALLTINLSNIKNVIKKIAFASIIVAFIGCSKETSVRKKSNPTQESPGVGLRKMALTTPAIKLGFTPDAEYPIIYGILTDWDIDGVTASIMSMRDGTASLYTTAAFGIIGGEGDESVRQAAQRYVKVADQFVGLSKASTDYSYPKSGQVFYFLLTYDGVRRIVGNKAEIERGTDPTMPLFAAAQDVLTELRLIIDKQNTQPKN